MAEPDGRVWALSGPGRTCRQDMKAGHALRSNLMETIGNGRLQHPRVCSQSALVRPLGWVGLMGLALAIFNDLQLPGSGGRTWKSAHEKTMPTETVGVWKIF